MMSTNPNMDGPIPGENYTSDTRNYPWHQPPEFADISEALDKMSVTLTTPKIARPIMAFAEAGFPLVNISMMIVMQGLSEGKWTMDMGILLAGPITKIIEIMCDSYDIKYTLGFEEDDSFLTGTFFKTQMEFDKQSKEGKIYKIVNQEMDKIEDAAVAQEDNSAGAEPQGGGGEADLAESGFASMTSAKPPKQGAK